MRDETRFAILIDAENISPKYVQIIFDEVSNYGISTYRRIYGDWTNTRNNRWKEVLLDNSVTPIQQYSYTEGKNSSDSAMIIDAMDILYTLTVDGFVLVSSDSDFTRLASRLRESGMTVIGMGESKTPNAFISACNTFKYLDILYESQKKEEEEEHRVQSRPSRNHRLSLRSARAQRHKSEEKVLHDKSVSTTNTPSSSTKADNTKSKVFDGFSPANDNRETEDEKIAERKSEAENPSSASNSHRGANVLSRKEWKESTGQNKNWNKSTLEPVIPEEETNEALPKTEENKDTHSQKEKTSIHHASRHQKDAPRPQTTIGAVRRALRNIVRENSDEENWISLANLGNQLSKRFPDFDVRNYGHQKLVTFIESFHEFEVVPRAISELGNKQLFVRLKEE